ncbi:hypothetical protein, partial [Pseudotabrizicola sediminis]|uniref:hypothetical protein n=1 Tax=Pseudotabrizicola sediminis TaxID=2486418 RepID=UPI001436B347
LAAISSRTNRTIRFDQPVSASAVDAISRINYTFWLWSLASISPPRLELTNIVPDPVVEDSGHQKKVICLSGGVDSVSSAIAAKAESNYTHGLLIAGADYPSAEHQGFIELQDRVDAICKIIGLDLVVVETNFRTMMSLDWELHHSFLLAMSLHYHSDLFSEGSYALDAPPINEIIQHPWGNCFALMHLFSLKALPLRAYGNLMHRAERAKFISNYSTELINKLSVCWVDTSTGSNCGHCLKCRRTRDIFDHIGISTKEMFKNHPDPSKNEKIRIPNDYTVRMKLVAYADWAMSIEKDTPRGRELEGNIERLRRSYVRQMPYR